jgi:general secretion pathway protein E
MTELIHSYVTAAATADSAQDGTIGHSAGPTAQPLYSFAKRFRLVVQTESLLSDSGAVPVFITAKTPPQALLEIRRLLQRPVAFRKVDESDLNALLAAVYEHKSAAAMQAVEHADANLDLSALAESILEIEDLLENDENSPIIRLINAILTEALREEASDIHIETFEQRIAVRFRVDGVLREVLPPKRALAQLLVSRIKVMARLDIAEKRVPQDGRISLRIGDREVDVRVSTIPTRHGERVVLRLLDKRAGRIDLAVLGMSEHDLPTMQSVLAQPHGVILVTGPTGSGKSTTLYAGLSSLNNGTLNILTIEDPIEYDLSGIGQTQVNTKAGMSFARGLRAILRQDPDIVMIGEIRDAETAEIAIQASLTGHLVLSTLHTNTAIGAITRLIDMGVEPFLVSSSLSALIAQRLVRQLCPACKQAYTADAATRRLLRCDELGEPLTLYRATGCKQCHQQGYRGRTGIYEIVPVNDALRDLIHNRAGEQELTRLARTYSSDIFQDGVGKVLAGQTAVDELLRVVHAQ